MYRLIRKDQEHNEQQKKLHLRNRPTKKLIGVFRSVCIFLVCIFPWFKNLSLFVFLTEDQSSCTLLLLVYLAYFFYIFLNNVFPVELFV